MNDQNQKLGEGGESTVAFQSIETKPTPEWLAAPSFTEGKWVAVKAVHGDDDPDPERWSVCTDSQPQWFVATIENGTQDDTLDTEAANARLIAASPLLYEATVKLLSAMEMQEGREREELHITQPVAKDIWDRAKDAARAALLLANPITQANDDCKTTTAPDHGKAS